jgi:hypothetical protein
MTEREGEDISIIAHSFGDRALASREVALVMAEMLIRESRGEEFLKTQLPLQAIDGGDRWIIEGSRKGEDYPLGPTGLLEHEFVVKILKRNCQVLSFAGT